MDVIIQVNNQSNGRDKIARFVLLFYVKLINLLNTMLNKYV